MGQSGEHDRVREARRKAERLKFGPPVESTAERPRAVAKILGATAEVWAGGDYALMAISQGRALVGRSYRILGRGLDWVKVSVGGRPQYVDKWATK